MASTTILGEVSGADIALKALHHSDVSSPATHRPALLSQGELVGESPADTSSSPAELEVSADEEARSQRAVALPPIDGGVRAWLVIVYLEFTVVS